MNKSNYLYVIGSTIGLQNIGITKHLDERLSELQADSDLPLIIHFKTRTLRPRRILWSIQWAFRKYRQEGDKYNVTPVMAVQAIQERL